MIPPTVTFFSQLFGTIPHPAILTEDGVPISFNSAAEELIHTVELPIRTGFPLPDSLAAFLPLGSEPYKSVGNCVLGSTQYEVRSHPVGEGIVLILNKQKFTGISHQMLASITNKLQDSVTPLVYACHLITPLLEETKNPQAIRYISIFNQNCYRLIRTLNTLSAFEKAKSYDDAPPLENLDIALLCRRVVEQAAPLAKLIDITIRQEVMEGSHIIRGSAPDLECMLYHLLSNAMKFTPQGGEILLHFKVSLGMVYITVSDNGSGIPDRILNSVFTRFQEERGLTDTNAGIGLGLALVRQTAALCGGSVALTSKEGGTRVTVSLPNRKNEDNVLFSPRIGPGPGGFSNVLVELSDALPPNAFYPQDIE